MLSYAMRANLSFLPLESHIISDSIFFIQLKVGRSREEQIIMLCLPHLLHSATPPS